MEIYRHHQELAVAVKSKKLEDAHQHAFAIRDLRKALPAKVPAEHKKHVENMVKRLSQSAADLDKSGDAGDQAKTEVQPEEARCAAERHAGLRSRSARPLT